MERASLTTGMSQANSKTLLRIAVIVALMGLIAAYIYWKTEQTYLYAEVEPGFVYQSGMRDADETINAANVCGARTLVLLMPSSDRIGPVGDTVAKYGFRSKLRVAPLDNESGTVSRNKIEQIIKFRHDNRRPPILLISPDGKLAGMAAAAYRLTELKMPLDKVLELAAVPGASDQTTQAIRDFATRYAADMKAAANAPSTAPANPASAPAGELQPAGPAVR